MLSDPETKTVPSILTLLCCAMANLAVPPDCNKFPPKKREDSFCTDISFLTVISPQIYTDILDGISKIESTMILSHLKLLSPNST